MIIELDCVLKGIIAFIIIYLVNTILNQEVSKDAIHELRHIQQQQKKEIAYDMKQAHQELQEEFRTIEAMAQENMTTLSEDRGVILFYGSGCSESLKLIPTWQRMKQSMPFDVDKLEFEAHNNKPLLDRYGITQLPSVVISVGGSRKILPGARTWDNYKDELELFGIHLDDLKEDFISTPTECPKNEADDGCGNFWFEKKQNDTGHKYCIHGGGKFPEITGCAEAKNQLDDYSTAFSVFGSYAISHANKTPEEFQKCCKIHKHSVENLGLDNGIELSKKLNYKTDENSGKFVAPVDGVDYNDNLKIAQCINYATRA